MKIVAAVISASLFLSVSAVQAKDIPSFSDLLSQSAVAAASSDWSTGVKLARSALELPNLTPEQTFAAYSHLCTHLTNSHEFDAAWSACNKSVELQPASYSGYLNRGNLQLAFGNEKGALADYKHAQALNPSAATLKTALSLQNPSNYVVLMPRESAQVADAAE